MDNTHSGKLRPGILSIATAELYVGYKMDYNHLIFPRVDYIELQNLVETVTMDYSSYNKTFAGTIFRHIETQLRSDIFLGTSSWWRSRNYGVLLAWSERAGIPIAGYKRYLPTHTRFMTIFTCWSKRQELAITSLGLFSAMDDIIVHCASMKQELVRLGAPADRVKLVRYSIDQKFFSPIVGITQQKNLIVSLGEPRSRDYAALFKAVDGLPVILQAPVYGQWYAREKNKKINTSPPDNTMMMKHLSPTELRYFYASSLFVVLPVYDLVYSAGATVALEAACMARAVIAFRSRGISDYIIDGETGILVEPGNIKALREAIQHLVSNPSEAKRLGDNARQRIVDELNLETYVHNLAEILVKSV